MNAQTHWEPPLLSEPAGWRQWMEVRHGAKRQEKQGRRKAKTVEGCLFSSGTVSVETRRGHSVSGTRARKILENLLCLLACLLTIKSQLQSVVHLFLSDWVVLAADNWDQLSSQVEAKRSSTRLTP